MKTRWLLIMPGK